MSDITSTKGTITAEKSQRSPSETAWWWLSGDTYPHREALKRWGGRWSKRQKRWYFIADELPQAVQALITDQPCSVEEAERILGVDIQPPETPRLFALNETVYARHDLETPDGQPIPTGTRGTITRLYNRNAKHGWSYDVDFAEIGIGWYFERELTPLEPLPGIRITRGAVVPPGAILPPTDAEIKHAIRPRTTPTKRTLAPIGQAPCGELTGSITGNVWCYGWAIHDGVCVYVNCGGPRMAVEAIRAKLAKGDVVNCVPYDAPSVELTAGEGNTGMYTAFMQNIPEAKFTSLILCHELVTQPNYAGKSTTFIFEVDEAQAMAQLREHITKLVNVPVFDAWTAYLWQAGQSAMLLRPTRSGGDVKLWTLDLDAEAWTRLITGGLDQSLIHLPQVG